MMDNQNNPSVVIKTITFNDGSEIEFNSDDIVLLVGANNVGKSRTLKDLQEDLIDCGDSKVLVSKVNYQESHFTTEQMMNFFEKNVNKDSFGNYVVTFKEDHTQHFSKDEFNNILENAKNFHKVLYSFLSTEKRLSVTKPIRFNYDVDKICLNILKKLDEHEDSIRTLNDILTAAFDKSIDVYEYYDDILIKEYKIGDSKVIADAINSTGREEQRKLQNLESLHYQGDGIRSAVAILSSLIVNEHSLFLIDEPETFLHPPQAKLIGKNIVQLSENKQCFIATHNIDFIKGVVETNSSRVKIIKIDRVGNQNTFNLINNSSIFDIANDKNLKYTNILDGLFYNHLVLCENESDCKFYSALLESIDFSTYQGTLFCAVGGKDQFKKVVPLLSALNIQYLVIADIDLIDNKDNLNQLLDSIETDCYEKIREKHADFLVKFEEAMNSQVKTQSDIQKEINAIFTADKYMSPASVDKIKSILKDISCLKLLKTGGKSILPQGDCTALFNEINNYLHEHNIFVVECGEIERFVPDVGGHGNKWLEKVFEKYSTIDDSVYSDAKQFVKVVFGIN